MRVFLCLALCWVLTSVALQAESNTHKWLRRAITVAGCAASAIDGYETATSLGHGLNEGNSLLANPNGSAKVGRMVSLKLGVCGAAIFVGEEYPVPGFALSASQLGVFALTDIHNAKLK
jgi:hypothetical protein